eukprot:27095-Prorocentrum_minimum.AAC.2
MYFRVRLSTPCQRAGSCPKAKRPSVGKRFWSGALPEKLTCATLEWFIKWRNVDLPVGSRTDRTGRKQKTPPRMARSAVVDCRLVRRKSETI